MADLTIENQHDLVKYHNALKQFLDMSAVSTKTNTNRALKARDKLLKLSDTQFFELSTDVYDELQRRIDESSAEPDFLLPKSNFHPKRNEAREKLGSLQQTRFRDLVSDILFEIERRNHDKLKRNIQTVPTIVKNDSQNTTQPYLSTRKRSSEQSKASSKTSSNEHKPQGVVSVQSTTVIPTRANIAWSSDEEEENDGFDEYGTKIPRSKHSNYKNIDNTPSSSSQQHKRVSDASKTHKSHGSLENVTTNDNHKNRLSNSSNQSVDRDTLGELNSSINGQSRLSRGLSVSKPRSKDRDIELLIEEGTKMDQTITHLEQKITLLQSKAEKFENEAQELQKINESLENKVAALEREVGGKDKEYESVIGDLTRHKELLEEEKENSRALGSQNSHHASTTVLDDKQIDQLKSEVAELKAKLENFKSKKIEDLLSLDVISDKPPLSLFSKTGLVPYSLYQSFRLSVQDFLIELNQSSKSGNIDVSSTFSHISKISKSATTIGNFLPHSEKSELIRASVSHAITSTRYYTVYGSMLPKLVIQSSISELVFAVYDFLNDVKLNRDNNEYSIEENSRNDFTNSSIDRESDEEDNDVSPVRPLRMTKKAEPSPIKQDSTSSNDRTRALNPQPNISIDKVEQKSFHLGGISNNELSKPISNSSTPQISTPLRNGFPSVVSRFSPSNEKYNLNGSKKSPQSIKIISNNVNDSASAKTPEVPRIRKSSSGNILSKVKQFEQQSQEQDRTGSPSPISIKKSVVSPLSDTIVGKFGTRKPSVDVEASDESFKPVEIIEPDLKSVINNKVNNEIVDESPTINLATSGNTTNDIKSGESKTSNSSYHDKKVNHITVDELRRDLSLSNSKSALSKETQDSLLKDNEKDYGAVQSISQSAANSNAFSNSDLKSKSLAKGPLKKDPEVVSNVLSEENPELKGRSAQGLQLSPEKQNFEEKAKSSSNDAYDQNSYSSSNNEKSSGISSKGTLEEQPVVVTNGSSSNKSTSSLANPVVISKSVGSNSVSEITPNNKAIGSAPISQQDESPIEVTDSEIEDDDEDEDADGIEDEFDIDEFDIEDPDNTLSDLLLYLEHQTVKVIATIQALLTAIKSADSTNGQLRTGSKDINDVVSQMVEATSNSMNQSRNAQLKAHGSWVVDTLSNSGRRMKTLCEADVDARNDEDYADKNFKQRLAGIAFDVAKCTKELVKTVEEANLKEEIDHLNKKLIN